MAWHDMAWQGMAQHSMEQNGMARHSPVQFNLVQHSTVQCNTNLIEFCFPLGIRLRNDVKMGRIYDYLHMNFP